MRRALRIRQRVDDTHAKLQPLAHVAGDAAARASTDCDGKHGEQERACGCLHRREHKRFRSVIPSHPVSKAEGAFRWTAFPARSRIEALPRVRTNPASMTPPDNKAAVPPIILPVHQVHAVRPLLWLRLGWRDFKRTPWSGMLHGLVVALGGIVILAASFHRWYLLPGAFSAFVLVGPVFATGLYEQSRLLSRGRQPTLGDAIGAWRRGTRPLVWLGVLLGIAGTLWVLMSAGLFAIFVRTPITGPESFLRYAVQTQPNFLFISWSILGGLVAAVVFAATVVSPPLLLGRVIDLRGAILTSVRAVGENPVAMAVWATIIMLATALSLATAMLGFIVAIPVIGHATWHAYRDLVDASSVPLRN